MSTKRGAISLYRQMLRESEKLPAYNFRMYAARKIRDMFRLNKDLKTSEEIGKQLQLGQQNLQLIRRQAIIGHLYRADKLVIERNAPPSKITI